MVLFAALASSLDERLHEGALLRTLGGRSRLLKRMLTTEFILLGLVAGLAASGLVELLRWALYSQLLELSYRPHPMLWLLCPLTGALLVGVAGRYGTRKLLQSSPLRVLQISASDMLRVRWNPFYPYVEARVLEFLGLDGT